MNGDFTCLGFENKTFDFNNITDIIFLEIGISFFAYVITSDINLHFAFTVMDVHETCFTHGALCHDSAADGNILIFKLIIFFNDLCTVIILLCKSNLERILTCFLKCSKLVNTDLSEFVDTLFRRFVFSSLILNFVCHFYAP